MLDRALIGRKVKPYSHLALRPYPEEYVRKTRLADGTEVTLRPIKPEDEPLWMELLRSCSPGDHLLPFPLLFLLGIP